MWDKLIKGLAAAAGAIAGLLGGWNLMLTLLAIAMALDYVSGVVVGWAGKSPKTEGGGVSSAVGFKGLLKKAVIMGMVLLATLLDRALGTGSTVFQTAAVFYYLANEGLSIIENAALMGVPFPPKVKATLEAMKAKGDDVPPTDPGNPA